MNKLSLGYSPCPNDCFIFDALVHKKIDTQGLDFDVVLEDVETLNKNAFQTKLDVTKLSYHALAYLTDTYSLLNSGSALGFNCGPLLVGDSEITVRRMQEYLHKENADSDSYRDRTPNSELIAIPGKYTTANFLLSLAYPNAKNKVEMLFSEIESAVLSGKADAGLIIHENRFTYQDKGLKKIIDLGEFWEGLIKAPIPLGGIVVKRSIDNKLQKTIDELIKKSVEYAFANPESCMDYVKAHAQEMSEEVMKKHIALYVNEFSVNLGELGRKAVNTLFNKAIEMGVIKGVNKTIFVQ
jgi:1,4-dihydroxy-6-naphthoate synthase